MPHKLEKFYSSFGGVDTRSNKLIADPKTFRKGSKNFRYNFQDEIQNANGWQHKTENTPVSFVDIFEYKYRDVNTGESKSQVLAVGADGNLYRKIQHTLKWIATGTATSYSFFYDEVGDVFKITVNGVGSVNISESMTLEQLKTALNALTGITVDIVDNDGISVSSSKLAYLLDVRIEDKFNLNSSWFWEKVLFPDITCISSTSITESNLNLSDPTQYTQNSVPFKTALASHASDDYEGISTVNINNSIYITDGGFPLKYDGKAVYRAGVPKSVMVKVSNRTVSIPPFGTISPYENITGQDSTPVSPISGSSALPDGYYGYKFRFAFTDYNGFTSYGDIIEDVQGPQITPFPTSTQNYQVRNRGYWYGKDFPVFAAKIDGDQGPGTSGGPVTLNVFSGHNIIPGMVIRQITRSGATTAINTTSKAFINFYAKVTSVTATTITLQETVCTAGDQAYTSGFLNGEIINAYFVQDFYINKRPFQYYSQSTINPIGSYLEVYRTKKGDTADAAKIAPYYHVFNMAVPFVNGDRATIIDDKADSLLTELLDDQAIGGELPRACSYLTKWQDCTTQAGSPFNTLLKNDHYPSIFYVDTPLTYCQEAIDTLSYYGESMLCDPQSIYWNDPLTPEGFPQDGLHEFAIDTEYNDAIKGIAPNKDALFAIKERSTGILTGDLGTNDIVLEVLEDDIGLASHKTLQQTKGALIWLDPIKGFYACVAGRLPQHIGYPICDYMQINSEKLDYSKAAAMNARAIGMYICVVGSTWFVYDYSDTQNGSRNCWYIWERFSSKSALFTADNEIILLSDKVWKMKVTNTRFDMTDHKDAIEMDARQAWWNGGLPTIDKMFERLWANSIQGGFTLSIDQYANYLDDRIASIDVGFKEAPKKTVKDYAKAAIPKLSAISFGLRNSEKNKLVRIQGFEIEYAADFDPSEPRR